MKKVNKNTRRKMTASAGRKSDNRHDIPSWIIAISSLIVAIIAIIRLILDLG